MFYILPSIIFSVILPMDIVFFIVFILMWIIGIYVASKQLLFVNLHFVFQHNHKSCYYCSAYYYQGCAWVVKLSPASTTKPQFSVICVHLDRYLIGTHLENKSIDHGLLDHFTLFHLKLLFLLKWQNTLQVYTCAMSLLTTYLLFISHPKLSPNR